MTMFFRFWSCIKVRETLHSLRFCIPPSVSQVLNHIPFRYILFVPTFLLLPHIYMQQLNIFTWEKHRQSYRLYGFKRQFPVSPNAKVGTERKEHKFWKTSFHLDFQKKTLTNITHKKKHNHLVKTGWFPTFLVLTSPAVSMRCLSPPEDLQTHLQQRSCVPAIRQFSTDHGLKVLIPQDVSTQTHKNLWDEQCILPTWMMDFYGFWKYM